MNSLAANCWRCGPKKLYPILRAFGATKQALATLYRFRNVAPNPFDEKELSRGKYKPPASIPLSDAPRIFSRYVNHRGMNCTELSDLWGVQAIVPPSKWEWRLLIPISYWDRCVSWTTRSISTECPHSLRYLTSPPDREIINSQSILYGADYCRHSIVLVEGPIDAWAIGPGAVSTMGLTISPQQMRAIGQFPVRIIAFDNEAKAQQRARKLKRRLDELPGETTIFTFTGKDAASTSLSDIQKLREMLNE